MKVILNLQIWGAVCICNLLLPVLCKRRPQSYELYYNHEEGNFPSHVKWLEDEMIWLIVYGLLIGVQRCQVYVSETRLQIVIICILIPFFLDCIHKA